MGFVVVGYKVYMRYIMCKSPVGGLEICEINLLEDVRCVKVLLEDAALERKAKPDDHGKVVSSSGNSKIHSENK